MSKTIKTFRDGDKICAVFDDFINLQESPAAFGDTADEAIAALKSSEAHKFWDPIIDRAYEEQRRKANGSD